MGLILDSDKAALWRGPMLSGAIKQLIHSTEWGDLDYLFIDMPPGTGDPYLTINSEIKPDSSILITTPSKLAEHDLVKSIEVFNKLDINILGYVENNISNKKISYDFKLLDNLDLKKLVSISFCDEIYEFNPKKIHDSIKDLSSLI
jgi:ATP-binding protein involved in chromosome partitioning